MRAELCLTRASTDVTASSRGRPLVRVDEHAAAVEQPVLAGLPVGTCVAERDPRGRGERDGDLLVARGEVGMPLLVREVEVAEDGTAREDGDAEERVHRRMVLRETHRRGVVGEVVQPQRVGLDTRWPSTPLPSGR